MAALMLLSLLVTALLPLGLPDAPPPLRVPEDHPTIEDAIAAIQAALALGEETSTEICVGKAPDGAYGPVVVQGGAPAFDLTIRGKGGAVIDGGGVATGLTVVWPDRYVTIENLRIVNGAPYGVHRVEGEMLLERCRIEDSASDGIHVEFDPAVGQEFGFPQVGELYDVELRRNEIHGTGAHGIGIGGEDTFVYTIIVIEDCSIRDVPQDGIHVGGDRAWRTIAVNNRIRSAGGHGIWVTPNREFFHGGGNRILDVGLDGLHVEDPSLLFGMFGGPPANLSLRRNVVKRAGGNGIDSRHASPAGPVDVLENRICDVGGDGIVIREGTPGLRRNRVRRAGGSGIVIEAGGLGLVLDNRVARSGADGFLVAGDDNTLTANRAMRSGANGFHVTGDDNVLVENVARKSAGLDLLDEGAGTVLTDNTFGTQGP